jgi:hypothetical protein
MSFFKRLSECANTDPNATTDILVDRWEEGYEKGKSDQKGEDADAYVEGYDRGFDKGEAATIKTPTELGVTR